jgi:hypothetical protein
VAGRRVAVIAAAIAGLAIGCSTPPQLGAEQVKPSQAPTTAPADGCAVLPTLALGQPMSVIIDYVDFIRFEGREYLAGFTPTPPIGRDDLGQVVTESRCSLSQLNARTGMQPPGPTDGDTGFLTAGTEIHAVRGWSPACRLAAEHDGRLHVYLAQEDGGDRTRPADCALG